MTHLRAYISSRETRVKHHTMHRLLFILTVLCFCRTISADKSDANANNNGIYYSHNNYTDYSENNYGIYNFHNNTDYNEDDVHIKEMKLYNERVVDMFLFHCLNNTLSMMDYSTSDIYVGYGSGLVAMHRCFRVLYMLFEEFESKTSKIDKILWDDTFKFTVDYLDPEGNVDDSVSSVVDDSVEQAACQVDYGSISRMPSISMCFIQDNTTKDSRLPEGARAVVLCDVHAHDIIPLFSNLLCSQIKHATIIAHFKAAWLLAKFNYGLIIASTLCVLLPTMRSTLITQRMRNSHSVILFDVLNALWMAWRLQETVQWDTKWQHGIPYICVATNTIRYLVEGVALFLFACTSLERYQAIAGTLLTSLTRKKVQLPFLSVTLGMITGGICSIMNIVALSIMTSPPALLLKTCSIHNNVPGSLILLIIAKVLSLVAMYLVPCSIMSAANIAMFLSVLRKNNKNFIRRLTKKPCSKKTSMITSFLVFSSVFMVCSISKPIIDLYFAIKEHIGMTADEERETVGVLLDAIAWNLTTIAYTINTIMGLRYTK